MSDNYPCGTGPSDPEAPWNEIEREPFVKCVDGSFCIVCEDFDVAVNLEHWCQHCFEAQQEIEETERWTD